MTIDTFSEKQAQVLKFAFGEKENVLLCDGAVRSGKTVVMSLAFLLWAMIKFDRCNFAICGKTVMSAERNILRPLEQLEGMPFSLNYKVTNHSLTVRSGKKENCFYLFGGKDESSYALIQGLTLAGVLFDEVALMPQSFVDQAIARTLSYSNAKIWFNCNPESPNHWFYKEWVDNPKRKFKHLHFLMNDNPILTQKEIVRAESLYTGVFYDRYIKGLWVRAEGIIFPDFANNPRPWIIKTEEIAQRFRRCEVGFDVGGHGSHHALTATAEGIDGKFYVLKSKSVDPDGMNMTDIERAVTDFCGEVEEKYRVGIDFINADWVDVVINSINDNTRYRCGKTYKPPLTDRPLAIGKLLAEKRVLFSENMCDDLIEELRNVCYDEKGDKDIMLDDGVQLIDCIDSFTYSMSGVWNWITKSFCREEK